MEIPRQKKTVRLAVTRPSVKKGAIVTLLKNRLTEETISIHLLLKFGLLQAVFLDYKHLSSGSSSGFYSSTRSKRAWSVLSFQFLAPERNCVLVSAHVPINPCK